LAAAFLGGRKRQEDMFRRKHVADLAGSFVVGFAMMTATAGAQVVYPYPYPTVAPAPVYVTPAYPPGYYYPPAVVAAPVQPKPQSWYYCDNPKGYYPTVPSCTTSWREVPAQVR
jgi:hypothetical protein